jgi:hypothetical protein
MPFPRESRIRPFRPGLRPGSGKKVDGHPHPPYFGGCVDLQNPAENGHVPGEIHVAVGGHAVEEGGKGLEAPMPAMGKASDEEGILTCFFETGFRGVGFLFFASGGLVLLPVFFMADRPGFASANWWPVSR